MLDILIGTLTMIIFDNSICGIGLLVERHETRLQQFFLRENDAAGETILHMGKFSCIITPREQPLWRTFKQAFVALALVMGLVTLTGTTLTALTGEVETTRNSGPS